jgi:hypothetical protein
MESIKLIELISFTLPAIITGIVAYSFFNLHNKSEQERRNYLLQKELQKDALPLRLQAYERMVLYLERINPAKLLIRVAPFSDDKNAYETFLIQQIEQELEHNLAQQIYLTDDCWTVINTTKNSIIQTLRTAAKREEIKTAQELRELILTDLVQKVSPTHGALNYLKMEVGMIIGR